MKKISVLLLAVLLLSFCAACGNGEKEKTAKDIPIDYISKDEAKIYFYEISSKYRFELMELTAEDLKNGAKPNCWKGLAPEVAECSFDELTDTYINEEELSALSTAYGANIANCKFGIYSIAEMQKGIDFLYGEGNVDVASWSGGNVDIVSRNAFGTAAGYLLYSKDASSKFDTQIYKIVSASGGEGTATVKAYAVSVDNITDNVVYDLATVIETPQEDGTTVKSYKKLENAAPDNFDYGANFSTNMKNMGVDEDSLGVVEFVFSIDGIAIHLDHIVPAGGAQ